MAQKRKHIGFNLRLRTDMHARVKASAAIDGRSMNETINLLLERALTAQDIPGIVDRALRDALAASTVVVDIPRAQE